MTKKDLATLRKEIDAIDTVILSSLAKRARLSKEIGKYKRVHTLKPKDVARWNELLHTRTKLGSSKGLTSSFVKKLYTLIHKESLKIQKS